ncbi:MAG: hypothetical protein A4E19_11590 [Nitrospira sp. SG-bin1]|nr:MAG: hypothetical protein A4E19_10065 [Nitrospira sp. SG-bin1]OQW38024.1 MAG: hypothetical protein A4E19_11590 [Nitrospira sp. SG-bin1]
MSMLVRIPPLTFCIAGLSWLILASILGVATLVGLVQGTPLPPWVGALHVHAVLVGGVAQIILGGFIMLTPPPGSAHRKEPDSHPLAFWALNGGVVGMLTGFWLHQHIVIGVAGAVVIAAFISIIYGIWIRANRAWRLSFNESWCYALSLFCLVGASVCGEIMALGFVPAFYGYARLAHIHLAVLGFVVVAIIGMVQHLLPTVWNRPHMHPRLARLGMIVMPIGMAVLIGGFLNSSVPIELAGGGILLIGGLLWTGNVVRTWLSSPPTGGAASDHLFISTFFLIFTITLGELVGVNRLSDPPVLPYGKLHLVAYTHMTFVGFIMNAVMGACSYFIPVTIAAGRVPNAKKRGLYLDQLHAIMNHWSTVQIASLSLGTMGLGLMAALTWNVPLASIYIRIAIWTSLGLLMTGLILFAVKLTLMLTNKPDSLRSGQTSTDELKLTA